MTEPQLTLIESRIVGALVEKELTTPAGYPLTLNALMQACNQKSNRHPVTSFSSSEIDEALSLLLVKGWVANTDVGGRTLKWTHRLGVKLGLTPEEVAVLTELMLRGGQQPGELRSRASRMHGIPDQHALMQILDGLSQRDPPLVVRIGRRAGERADRFMTTILLEDEEAPRATQRESRTEPAAAGRDGIRERLALLESEVAAIKRAMEELGWTGIAPDPEPREGTDGSREAQG